jgi:hypothetical protein
MQMAHKTVYAGNICLREARERESPTDTESSHQKRVPFIPVEKNASSEVYAIGERRLRDVK